MRPLIRAAILALLVTIGCVLVARFSPAQEIHFPSQLTIEGQPVCSGVPLTGDPLVFISGQWCNGVPNATCLNMRNSTNTSECALELTNQNLLIIGDNAHNVAVNNGAEFLPSTLGIGWNGGTDLTQIRETRATVGWYLNENLSTARTWGVFSVSQPSHVRGIHSYVQVTAATCTTSAHLELEDNGVDIAATDQTITNATTNFEITGLNIAIAAGDTLNAHVHTAAATCGTFPAEVNYNVEYTTD